MAHRFIGSNKRIIVLESSRVNQRQGFFRRGMRAIHRMDSPAAGEYHRQFRYEDPTVQPLCQGIFRSRHFQNNPGDADDFFRKSRVRCYGGTTNCWGGWTRPLARVDFDRRDLHPGFQWPITPEELHNQAVSKYCCLGTWDASAYDDPQFWVGRTEEKIAALELMPESPLQSAVFAIVNGGRGGGNSGRLNFQLDWGPDIEEAANVRVYRNANVRFLESNAGQSSVTNVKATTVNAKKNAGHDYTVTAQQQYVLAAGCIETARLLLVSDRLGDLCGGLGRNLMVHALSTTAAKFVVDRLPALPVRTFYSRTSKVKGNSDYPPSVFAALIPTGDAVRGSKIGNFRAIIDFSSRKNATGWVNFACEQTPHPDNRLMLDSSRDALFGDPRVSADLRMMPIDNSTFQKGLSMVGQELEGLGYAKTGTFTPTGESVELGGEHAMGATRMSRDADSGEGIVNPDCRVHRIDNLYVASGSVFPTGGFANPTLTIIALALRLAEHLLAVDSTVL